MSKFTVTLGPAVLILLLSIFSGSAQAIVAVCDVDVDGDVDRNDISAIFAARNTPSSGPDDPRDADGNGIITVIDGRLCVRQCTLARCAVVTPDVTPPTINIASPVDGAVLTSTPVLVTGTATDDTALASVTVNGVAATLIGDSFSASVPLAEGANTISAVATDTSGNTASMSIQVTLSTIDVTPPSISITSPVDGAVLISTTELVTGTATDETALASVTVNGVSAAFGGGTFSASVPLALGANAITAIATDTSGNTASMSITVTRVSPNPVANDDGYAALGNVAINVNAASGVLSNDSNAPTVVGALTVTAFDSSSANGGDVSVNADGSFSYNPSAGFQGADTFTYTITDVNGNTDTATVSVTVSNMVWFIDNTASAGGDGRITSPFDSVAAFGAAADNQGDTIFIYTGTGIYPGGLTLLNDQSLIGQGEGLGSITPPAFSLPLPGAGAHPTLNSSATAILLAQNNTVAGLDIVAVRGIRGGTVGTFTANNVSITANGGRALDINDGLLAVSLNNVNSSNSPIGGIRLSLVNGNFSVSETTSIDLPGGVGLPGIEVSSSFFNPGDSANFGNTTVSGGDGILLSANGPEASFTFNSLSVTTTAGSGLRVLDSGTLNIGGTTNSIAVTGTGLGAAVEITNTTIGASGITFASISADNVINGIVLNNTDTNGFTVTGDSGTAQNGSGGSIANVFNDGIALSSTGNIVLNQMAVSNTMRHGLFGNGVDNLTINNSTFDNNGDADNEDALSFRSGGAALTGTVVLDNVDVSNFHDTGLYVSNSFGTVDIDVIHGSDFDNNDDVNGTHGIFVQTSLGAGNSSLLVNGSNFNNLEGDIVRFEGGGLFVNDVDILNSTSTNGGGPDNFPNGGGINLLVTSNATVTFDVQGNDLRDMPGDIINIAGIGIAGGGRMEGRIGGPNDSDGNIISGGTGTFGDGIRIDNGSVNPFGADEWTILVQNNRIGVDDVASCTSSSNCIGDDGIQVLFRDTDGTLNLTVLNNAIANTVSEGIRMFFDEDTGLGGSAPNAAVRVENNTFTDISNAFSDPAIALLNRDTSNSCYHVSGNSGSPFFDIFLSQLNLATLQITQASTAALSTDNSGAPVSIGGSISFNGTCTFPLPAN